MGFGLNVSCHCHRHRLPLEASILFLVLAITTEGVDLVAQGEVSIPGGLCGLCCRVVLISGASILLLGLFFWFSTDGLCGLCCWVCFDSALLDCVDCVDSGCVDLVAGFVFLVFYRWIVWIVLLGLFRFRVAGLCGLCCWVVLILGASIWVCFYSFLSVGCVDSDVIPVWIMGVGWWLCG